MGGNLRGAVGKKLQHRLRRPASRSFGVSLQVEGEETRSLRALQTAHEPAAVCLIFRLSGSCLSVEGSVPEAFQDQGILQEPDVFRVKAKAVLPEPAEEQYLFQRRDFQGIFPPVGRQGAGYISVSIADFPEILPDGVLSKGPVNGLEIPVDGRFHGGGQILIPVPGREGIEGTVPGQEGMLRGDDAFLQTQEGIVDFVSGVWRNPGLGLRLVVDLPGIRCGIVEDEAALAAFKVRGQIQGDNGFFAEIPGIEIAVQGIGRESGDKGEKEQAGQTENPKALEEKII